MTDRNIAAGSLFDQAQVRFTARVVVLGSTAVTNLFGGDSAAALHSTVRIKHQSFKVIGVRASVGLPDDDNVVLPLDTARSYIFGRGDIVNQVTVQAASVAAVSLLVGSIGVLNIMLVSVTERTREIGIRKAIGATRRAILGQFLIESIVLAGLGGALGVGIGIGLSLLGGGIASAFASQLGPPWPVRSRGDRPAVVGSFAISLVIGLLAGGYPAYRAARLRPIDALRYE